DHPPLQQTLLEIISRRPGWGDEVVGLVGDWLRARDLTSTRKTALHGLVSGLAKDKAMQNLVAHALEADTTSTPIRAALLESMTALDSSLPPGWAKMVGDHLNALQEEVILAAIDVVRAQRLTQFDDRLARLASLPRIKKSASRRR